MSYRYLLLIEYDGTFFNGWQRQAEGSTVQAAIEDAILEITGQKVVAEGAGRTDTGVHATGQVAHIDLSKKINPLKLRDGLNHFLRMQGAAVKLVESVSTDFHARFSAKARAYEYHIINRRAPSPLLAKRAWHVIAPLEVDLMHNAAQQFVGHHDFSSFRSSECQSSSPMKTLTYFDVRREGDDRIRIKIQSRSFLHNQVRIMVGTLVMIGQGKLSPDIIPQLLVNQDRTKAGLTAPPYGLYLVEVLYED